MTLEQLSTTVMGHIFAFLSLSRNRDNILMWSHYADSHAGFVIGFDADNEFFAPGRWSLNGLRDVNYSCDRYVLPPNGLEGLSPDEMEIANTQLVLTKSFHWKYEEELRLMAMPSQADKTITIDGKPIHLYDFPTIAVREVIFGCRMATSIKEDFVGLIEEKYPHVALMQAVISIDKFAVDIVPYTQFAKNEQR